MEIEILVSALNKDTQKLIESINLETDAIIINQCNKDYLQTVRKDNNTIKVYSFNERGVGKSRNNALIRSSKDILLFVDDDETLINDYKKIIIKNFEKHPDADVILFNIHSKNAKRPTVEITKEKKAHLYNSLKYGAVNIAIKRNFAIKERLSFSLLFGGGAKYLSGEDSLFICDIFKRKGKVYTSTDIIGEVDQTESTWFNGYDKNYFKSKGALFYSISKTAWPVIGLAFLIKHPKLYKKVGFHNAMKRIISGAKEMAE